MERKARINEIVPVSQEAKQLCRKKWNHVAKPLESLGELEELIVRCAGITRTALPQLKKKCVLVFCADNGIVECGVAQSDHAVTTSIAQSMVRHTTSVCTMASAAGADVFPVDVGMIDSVEGMIDCKLMNGTRNFTKGPAMDRETAVRALEVGISMVEQRVKEGYQLIATGEAGIGNTTTSSAICAVLLDMPVETVTGRGSGLTNEGLVRKIETIEKGIRLNKPDPKDPVDVLSKVGGLDIAAMAGAFLGGAMYHVPVIADGLISMVAALVAVRLNPLVKGYILPSHLTAEPAGQALCRELEIRPIINAGMRLGEGTGAVALMPLLDLASAVYYHAASFEEISVEAYQKLC